MELLLGEPVTTATLGQRLIDVTGEHEVGPGDPRVVRRLSKYIGQVAEARREPVLTVSQSNAMLNEAA